MNLYLRDFPNKTLTLCNLTSNNGKYFIWRHDNEDSPFMCLAGCKIEIGVWVTLCGYNLNLDTNTFTKVKLEFITEDDVDWMLIGW